MKDVFLLLALLLLIGGALWGLHRQQLHVQASLGEYAALQNVETAEARLGAYQQAVHAGHARDPQAVGDLRSAVLAIGQYKAMIGQYKTVLPAEITPDLQASVKSKTQAIAGRLVGLLMQVDPPRTRPLPAPASDADISASVDALSRDLGDLVATCNGFVHRTQLASDHDLQVAISAIAAGAACIVALAVSASLWQYRQVIVPLHRLRAWCRAAAGGEFPRAYEPSRDREFQDLARDVNQMAEELTAFHRRLEAMVAEKSRQLVRSERLASVGFLAAGVAHEINSPLNIMSGYAELALKRLRRLDPAAGDGETAKYMTIIRSEAFRCKDITQRLLSLARGDGDARQAISMTQIVTEVSGMVRGLKSFIGKSLDTQIDLAEPLTVLANPAEMKQVLLNVLVNAIEAVPASGGMVTIAGRRSGQWVELEMADNGRGMTRQTLEHIFEPFFTNKRGAGDPGTGLGLSITHAILEAHGGRIDAHSAGPGLGSRLIIRLPALAAAAPVAATTVAAELIAPAVTEAIS
ncbi:MAG TPA: HAMP domain-containing sensor histidine kinase [Tepidisphaeraceae bacterium]|nr:HAMP domain-containing sensor histidine kinase [Tepidisphaeraceae bacterium]